MKFTERWGSAIASLKGVFIKPRISLIFGAFFVLEEDYEDGGGSVLTVTTACHSILRLLKITLGVPS